MKGGNEGKMRIFSRSVLKRGTESGNRELQIRNYRLVICEVDSEEEELLVGGDRE